LERDNDRGEEATTFFKKAIDLHKKTGFEDGLAVAWSQLGQIYQQTGQDQLAETCFNYAYSHFSRLGNPLGQAEVLRYLAILYEARNASELALRCMEQLMEVHHRSGFEIGESDRERLNRLQGKQVSDRRKP
jgi:tetratricopeptide (TPR) repeat protein